ncbi:MAG: hemin uptake protein HemP [Bradyrhizobiaceae bacterium]|nr:hemin uptake protein HemP [Bradyrhizobiaceae bacterium]
MKNSKLDEPPSSGASPAPPRSIPVEAHRIDSTDLFVGTREVTIRHGNEIYRLRLTAQNKLILTK